MLRIDAQAAQSIGTLLVAVATAVAQVVSRRLSVGEHAESMDNIRRIDAAGQDRNGTNRTDGTDTTMPPMGQDMQPLPGAARLVNIEQGNVMNLFQQLTQDLFGTARGQAIEKAAQPILTTIINPLAGAWLNLQASKSPTLATILADLEEAGGPLSSIATTDTLSQATGNAANAAVSALTNLITLELTGKPAAPIGTPTFATSPTVAQFLAIVNTALTATGATAADESVIDAALTSAASAMANVSEAQGLAYLNQELTSIGLPAADDPTFDAALTTAWTAAGYPVPATVSA